MKIDSRQHGAVTVLKPIGPVTLDDAEALGSRLMQSIRESRGRLVLDSSEVSFFDSRGLEALADAGDELQRTGCLLSIAGIHTNVRESLVLTELDDLFEYFDDVNAAVRSFL